MSIYPYYYCFRADLKVVPDDDSKISAIVRPFCAGFDVNVLLVVCVSDLLSDEKAVINIKRFSMTLPRYPTFRIRKAQVVNTQRGKWIRCFLGAATLHRFKLTQYFSITK